LKLPQSLASFRLFLCLALVGPIGDSLNAGSIPIVAREQLSEPVPYVELLLAGFECSADEYEYESNNLALFVTEWFCPQSKLFVDAV